MVGEDRGLWSDHFARESDQLILECDEVEIDGRPLGKTTLRCHYNRVAFNGEELSSMTSGQSAGSCASCRSRAKPWGEGI